ncbi:MAG: AAA family ATPase [Alkalinema sp. RU_4_3]|nr:AAA family ATPase [Alkalinema sp. RU_4_3]
MFLKRIQVPDFRVLKNVDITFDPQLEPRVFPLGSQNGGGKSTLLQLVFVLLHCAIDPEKLHLVENLLQGFTVKHGTDWHSLATIEIFDNKFENIKLEYLCYSRQSIRTLLNHQAAQSPYCQNIIVLSPQALLGEIFLACRINASITSDLHAVLKEVAAHTFLAAPSTQIFHFLSLESRKKLFSRSSIEDSGSYIADLKNLQESLPNLFTYDLSLVDTLVNLFREARDRDFSAVVSTGQYGHSYHQILEKMNSALVGKQISSRSDLTGVQFHLDGSNTELQPEDLSHGELKRFSIYIWLTSQNLKDAIVLMDEIEIALHPDWQYQIVHDLVKWGPTNQYILATHSYELCQAVTPAHVKEITPNLLPQTV